MQCDETLADSSSDDEVYVASDTPTHMYSVDLCASAFLLSDMYDSLASDCAARDAAEALLEMLDGVSALHTESPRTPTETPATPMTMPPTPPQLSFDALDQLIAVVKSRKVPDEPVRRSSRVRTPAYLPNLMIVSR